MQIIRIKFYFCAVIIFVFSDFKTKFNSSEIIKKVKRKNMEQNLMSKQEIAEAIRAKVEELNQLIEKANNENITINFYGSTGSSPSTRRRLVPTITEEYKF